MFLRSRQLIIVILALSSFLTMQDINASSLQGDSPPDFLNPPNESRFTKGDVPPDIQWTAIAAADEYEIRFALDKSDLDSFSLFASDNHLDLAELIDQSTWDSISILLYCQVRALSDDAPITDWSEILEFSKSVSTAPTIMSPVNDARFVPGGTLPVFEWSSKSVNDTYCIEFAADPEFDVSYGFFQTQLTSLDCNELGNPDIWDALIGTFYWRVWSIENLQVPSPASAHYQFSKTVIDSPELIAPDNDTHYSAESSPPGFQWEQLPHHPDEYHIQFQYGQGSFPAGGSYIAVSEPSFSFNSIGITDEMWHSFFGKLRWRVAGVDQFGNHGGFSSSFTFTKVSQMNYMAYGDSVTGGYGASDWGTGYAGYPPRLQNMLRQRFSPQINVFCQEAKSWFPGAHGYTGSDNIDLAMDFHGPQHVLIMLGIVDIIDDGASGCEDFDCHTIEHLSIIINTVRDYMGMPYLATLPPVNPASAMSYLQDEVDDLNNDIRVLANIKGVPIAALDEAFFSSAQPLESYFTFDPQTQEPDWAHFNDSGYQLIAETWNELL